MAEVDLLASEKVARVVGAPHGLPDLVAQHLRDALVSVHEEHPFPPRLLYGEVTLGCEILLLRPNEHPRGEVPGHLYGPIRRLVVHDHDLVSPGQALQTLGEAPALIAGENAGGDRLAGSRHG